MYILKVTASFSSAHRLRGYNGECSRMHGHTWKVIARLAVNELNAIGLGYDFRAIKTHLGNVVNQLDHHILNEIPPFDRVNPTAENLAKYFHDQLKQAIPENVRLNSIEIQESDSSAVIYVEE